METKKLNDVKDLVRQSLEKSETTAEAIDQFVNALYRRGYYDCIEDFERFKESINDQAND